MQKDTLLNFASHAEGTTYTKKGGGGERLEEDMEGWRHSFVGEREGWTLETDGEGEEEMGKEWPREGQIRRCCHLVQDVEFRGKRKIEKILFLEERGKGFFFLSKIHLFAFLTLDDNCFSAFYCFILPSAFSTYVV